MIFAQYYLRLWMNGRTEHEECRRSGGVVYTAPSLRILGKILGTGSDRRHVTLTFKFTRFTVSNCAFTYLLEDLTSADSQIWQILSFPHHHHRHPRICAEVLEHVFKL